MDYKNDFVEEAMSFLKRSIEGLRGVNYSKNIDKISHQVIIPKASYSPWLDDKQFFDIYENIKDYTLVDIYRCYELYSFISRNTHLSGDILEVGVWKGGTGCLLSQTLNIVSPENKTFLADTFKGVVKAGEKDTIYKGGEHSDTSEETVVNLLNKNQAINYYVLKGIFPDEIILPNDVKSLRLCHIDVDTYESALGVFNEIYPLIVPGGAIMFDDYGFWGCEGVTMLCNEIKLNNLTFIHNLNGHGIFIKH